MNDKNKLKMVNNLYFDILDIIYYDLNMLDQLPIEIIRHILTIGY